MAASVAKAAHLQVPAGAWRQALSTGVRAAETSTHLESASASLPRTVEHPQACSISRSLMAAFVAKAKAPASACSYVVGAR